MKWTTLQANEEDLAKDIAAMTVRKLCDVGELPATFDKNIIVTTNSAKLTVPALLGKYFHLLLRWIEWYTEDDSKFSGDIHAEEPSRRR